MLMKSVFNDLNNNSVFNLDAESYTFPSTTKMLDNFSELKG